MEPQMHCAPRGSVSTPGSFHKLLLGPGLLLLSSEGGSYEYSSCGHLQRPATFSLAAEHLLYSFPHFLWSQRHHHLSYRRSLLLSTEGHSEELHHVTVFDAFQTI